jgi:hypothetical protein
MTEADFEKLEELLGRNPQAGEDMVGTGGCRKLRFAPSGRGKSGGYRVITFFTGPNLPVFLLTVFAKNERANLNQAERNGLSKLTTTLVAEYSRSLLRSEK